MRRWERPTVSAQRACGDLCECASAADEQFDELCFEFGIELDEVVRGEGSGAERAREKETMM